MNTITNKVMKWVDDLGLQRGSGNLRAAKESAIEIKNLVFALEQEKNEAEKGREHALKHAEKLDAKVEELDTKVQELKDDKEYYMQEVEGVERSRDVYKKSQDYWKDQFADAKKQIVDLQNKCQEQTRSAVDSANDAEEWHEKYTDISEKYEEEQYANEQLRKMLHRAYVPADGSNGADYVRELESHIVRLNDMLQYPVEMKLSLDSPPGKAEIGSVKEGVIPVPNDAQVERLVPFSELERERLNFELLEKAVVLAGMTNFKNPREVSKWIFNHYHQLRQEGESE